jgi:hypothetical protein
MNVIHTRWRSITASFGAAVAAASVLLSVGAGISHAGDFDPQPDPPGQSRGFNPQPEPPTRHLDTFNTGLKRMSVGA